MSVYQLRYLRTFLLARECKKSLVADFHQEIQQLTNLDMSLRYQSFLFPLKIIFSATGTLLQMVTTALTVG